MRKLICFTFLAALGLGIGLMFSCGDDDDDSDGDDDGDDDAADDSFGDDSAGDDDNGIDDDDTTPTSCLEAMDFLFGINGCFTLTDEDGNEITDEELCANPDYEDLMKCALACYDENDDCDSMGICITENCDLSF